MRAKDILLLGVKGMAERKLRTGLTILTIVIGVAAIVALIATVSGASASITKALETIGPSSIYLMPKGTGTIFTAADVAEIGTLPNVSTVIPMARFSANISVGGTSSTVTVIGVNNYSITRVIGGINLYQGTLYNETTIAPLAVVGYGVAFPNLGQISSSITVDQPIYLTEHTLTGSRSITLIPVGILKAYGSSFLVSPDDSVFVPLQEAQSITGRYSYDAMLVEAKNTTDVNALYTLLDNIYGSSATVLSVQSIAQTVSAITATIGLLFGAIAGISLIVAGISILSIMMVSVTERTHEIGILKSIGFKRSDILVMFLTEALVIGSIGGVLGVVVGSGFAYATPALLSGGGGSSSSGGPGTGSSSGFGGGERGGGGGVTFSRGSSNNGSPTFSPVVAPVTIIAAILVAIMVSLAASFYPAWKASTIDPIRALRAE